MNRGNIRWSWGRDADGVVWLTSNPQRAIRIAPDEQGPGLMGMAELYRLRPETLLSQILAHCRLREAPRPGSNYPRVIHAEPRATTRQVWLRSAVLELDADTKAVRKLALKRANKADGSTTTVTFTLIDTRPVDHARYGLEGNLVEPFQVYDRDFQPERRREILARWVGPHVNASTKITVPALFVVAEKEELSNNAVVEQVHKDIQNRGVPTAYNVIKDITHYGIYREGFAEAAKVEIEWFDKHLKGEK